MTARVVRLIYYPPGSIGAGWLAYSARYAATSIALRGTGVHLEVTVDAPDMPAAKREALRWAKAGKFDDAVDRTMRANEARNVVHVDAPSEEIPF